MKRFEILLALFACLSPATLLAQSKSRATSKTSPGASGFEALVKRADTARESDQTDEAIRLYKQVVGIKPNFAEGWWYLGMLYYEASIPMDALPFGV